VLTLVGQRMPPRRVRGQPLHPIYALPGPAVAECASRAGAGVVLTLTACYI